MAIGLCNKCDSLAVLDSNGYCSNCVPIEKIKYTLSQKRITPMHKLNKILKKR